jgi:hypothetical protein
MTDNVSILIQGGEDEVKDAIHSVIKDSLKKNGFTNVTSIAFNNEPIHTDAPKSALAVMRRKFPDHFGVSIQIASQLPVPPYRNDTVDRDLPIPTMEMLENVAVQAFTKVLESGRLKHVIPSYPETSDIKFQTWLEGYEEGEENAQRKAEEDVVARIAAAEKQGYADGRQDAEVEIAGMFKVLLDEVGEFVDECRSECAVTIASKRRSEPPKAPNEMKVLPMGLFTKNPPWEDH